MKPLKGVNGDCIGSDGHHNHREGCDGTENSVCRKIRKRDDDRSNNENGERLSILRGIGAATLNPPQSHQYALTKSLPMLTRVLDHARAIIFPSDSVEDEAWPTILSLRFWAAVNQTLRFFASRASVKFSDETKALRPALPLRNKPDFSVIRVPAAQRVVLKAQQKYVDPLTGWADGDAVEYPNGEIAIVNLDTGRLNPGRNGGEYTPENVLMISDFSNEVLTSIPGFSSWEEAGAYVRSRVSSFGIRRCTDSNLLNWLRMYNIRGRKIRITRSNRQEAV